MPAATPAVAVFPGTPGSVHLTEIRAPSLGPGQALVRVRRVGVCGTDQEIIAAKFGTPPAGSAELVLGHEVLGEVEAVAPGVDAVRPGDLVAATVRRPDGCPACLAGQPDFCVWRGYTERGIIGAHGYMVERFVDDARHLIPVPAALEPVGVLLEPLSVVEKAARQADLIQRRLASWAPKTALVLGAAPIGLLGTLLLRARGMDVVAVARRPAPNPAAAIVDACGARYVSSRDTPLADLAAGLPPLDLVFEATGVGALAFQAMDLLGSNGVLVLLSITGGEENLTIPADRINREFVLGNKVLVGSVNSAHDDFVAGVADLARFEELWPSLTARLITHRLNGFADAPLIAGKVNEGIKTVLEFA
ncbi:MAG: glucose 1-dehydrogenase [Chloroflexota bacterium]|nr:glucose 1-dehydrogenase [Chloroflexota bacterium]